MATVNSRQLFKDYCLRRLGAPVINIEVSDDQVEDRIDDALDYFQLNHYDGSESVFIKWQLTETDISNQYLEVGEEIFGITHVFKLDSTSSSNNMFSTRYQFNLHLAQHDFSTTEMNYYVSKMQNIAFVDDMINEVPTIRYNRHTEKLYIDTAWSERSVGDWVVAVGYRRVQPSEVPLVWSDKWLQRYATALISFQHATNVSKFQGMQLPGGVTFDGQALKGDAQAEVAKLEEEIQLEYQMPPAFFMG